MDSVDVHCTNSSVGGTIQDVYITTGIIIALGLVDLAVVFGNSLVVVAVLTTRKLRTVTNIFIVSLACADLLLGFAVLPFSISVEVLQMWVWGAVWCNMWLAIDVWLCTASILSLCAISMDRYIAVTRPIQYPRLVSPVRGKILVMLVWVLAFVICLPPLLGWNDEAVTNVDETSFTTNHSLLHIANTSLVMNTTDWHVFADSFDFMYNYSLGEYFGEELLVNITSVPGGVSNSCDVFYRTCELTPTKGYRIYAAMGSFFIPMFVMVFFYFRIYLAAIKTASSLRKGVLTTRSAKENARVKSKSEELEMRVHRGGSRTSHTYSNPNRSSPERRNQHNVQLEHNGTSTPHMLRKYASSSKQYLVKDKHKDKNKNNATIETVCESQAVLFIQPVSSHWKSKTAQSQTNDKCIDQESPEIEVLKAATHSISNGMNKLSSNANGLQSVPMNRSRKRDKAMNKESKFSFVVKGHARKFRRETKAAKTLAIIVGAFIVCWCPFFTIYLMGAFCLDCLNPLMFSIFFWLGYCNSVLNPCIYALFARDFRFAFRRLLSCRERNRFNQESRTTYTTRNRKTLTTPMADSESASDY